MEKCVYFEIWRKNLAFTQPIKYEQKKNKKSKILSCLYFEEKVCFLVTIKEKNIFDFDLFEEELNSN